MSHLGEKIRRFRLEKRMPEQEVADKMGISQNAYHKKEVGESRITVTELLKLAQIFEKPIEDFLKEELAIYNIQYNSNNHEPKMSNQSNGDFINERKAWEELVATQKMLIQRQAEEIDSLRQENTRLKPK